MAKIFFSDIQSITLNYHTPRRILLHQGRQYRTRAFSATFSGPDCQGPSYFVGGSCPGLQVLPSYTTQANDFSPYLHYFSSFLKTQYSVLLFNRLIVPALSNFKACAENVGSKNRTKWLYLFRNKSPISAPLQQELMTPHHQSQ